MALFKCKMCGGRLEINSQTVVTCEYCGTRQTLPRLDDERRINLYDRANHFRRNNEFDKAASIYDQILNENPTDAEAYWSLVLCRFGIEYVESPGSRKRLPTVNRAQFTSVFDDTNYTSALQYADTEQRKIFESEAKSINEIQKGILTIFQKEDPFDVFICYKETDNNGRRTPDSVLANELYHQLTQEGFRVFFSRITLEDKLGSAYEPYIFAALNSAKVMVVLGTRPEYFKAVWVRNEWSRYLSLVKASSGQKILIPAYRDMDPYDLPEEFSHLQAQDMSKLGFMQDLIRGIKKLAPVGGSKAASTKETVITETGTNSVPLLKRAFMFLEDGDWTRADEFCEQVLNLDPECARAYLGKLMAQLEIRKQEALKDYQLPFDDNSNYQKVLRFGDEKLVAEVTGYINHINLRNENNRLDVIYQKAIHKTQGGTEEAYLEAAQLLETIPQYKDAAELAKTCREKAEIARKDALYVEACVLMDRSAGFHSAFSTRHLDKAISLFQSLGDWKDSQENIQRCHEKIEKIKAAEEADQIAQQQRAQRQKQAEDRQKKLLSVVIIVAAIILAAMILVIGVIIPAARYHQAISLMEDGQYSEAIAAFEVLGSYKASQELILECRYYSAVELLANGDRYEAAIAFYQLGDSAKSAEIWNDIAVRNTISAGGWHTVVLKKDGTVVAVGDNDYDQCNVSRWTDIVAISAGFHHTVGLKKDGTVVAVGDNSYYQCNVSRWTDIVAISAGGLHTVGLKKDGTVVAVGNISSDQCNVSQWTDIIAISAGINHTVGLKKDGTVVAVGAIDYDQCNVSRWTDIVAISAGDYHTVGLKKDGTVVAVGRNTYDQCNVSDWKDIKLP